MPDLAKNVLGGLLETCSLQPVTGFFRDGCCNTSPEDVGVHTVCVVMTAEFLEFSKARGNDLSTPVPEFGFPGLQPGDLVTAVNGAQLDDPNRGLEMLRGLGQGSSVTVTIDRNGQQQQLTVDPSAVVQELQPVDNLQPPPATDESE